MARAGKANPDGYVHTRDGKEYQRLRDQARMWQAATAHVLAAVGLGPGMSCLDVGSGPGAVMRLMADRVGPEGRVTGIEIDGALGAEALQDLRREGGAELEQITADLLKLEAPAGVPFDLTFCRLLLMHMRDPVAILEKMSAWTKPGAWWWRRSSISVPSPSSRPAPPWANSTACLRACSEPTAATCAPDANCRHNSRRRGSARRTAPTPRFTIYRSRRSQPC